jgi:sugar transferase (PEP-CTERM/EpsH1 system associated)
MRILWLNAGLLLPLDKGGKLRTWHLMRHLAGRHHITYCSYADPAQSPADLDGMRQVCAELVTIPRNDAPKNSIRFYAEAAAYLLNPQPYAVAKYRSRAYEHALERLLATGRFDLIVCDFLPPLVNMPQRLPCPAVLFTHNVESEIWRRLAETQTDPVRRMLFRVQWRRMLRFERAALGRFDAVLAVSDADRETFRRLFASRLTPPIHVVPTGVDTSYFAPADPSAALPHHLVFTGSMDWSPNEDGMVYFCREIFPRIRHIEPDATLAIVGRSPTPAVQKLAEHPGVQVSGRVDDVRPHLARATVYVVPLRIGGGTRLKIFEAMAMGKAVVSTTVGAEGLPLTPGREILIADDPERFAGAAVQLLRDQDLRHSIESAARQLVLQHYDWAAVFGDLEAALVESSTSRSSQSAFSIPYRGVTAP